MAGRGEGARCRVSGVRGWRLGIGEQVSGDRGQGLGVRVWGLPELQPPGGVRIQDSRFNSRFKSRFDWIIGAPASGRSPEPRFTIQDSRWRIQNGEERGRAPLGPTSGSALPCFYGASNFQFRASSFACIGGSALRLLPWRFQFPVSSFAYIGGRATPASMAKPRRHSRRRTPHGYSVHRGRAWQSR